MTEQSTAAAQWPVWSTTARVVVTEAAHLDAARALVEAELDAVGLACSRFRDDSEIMAVNAAGGRPVRVSPLLADLVATALVAAERTAGDVDPTVGATLRTLGYDRDIDLIRAGAPTPPAPAGGPAGLPTAPVATTSTVTSTGMTVTVAHRRTWRDVRLDGDLLTVPAGVELDLGATAKARAADRAAATVAERLGCGVLVSLGGDIATAGPVPDGGWIITVADGPDEPECQIALAGGAVATSSTIRRTWISQGQGRHHIIDPATGLPAPPVWRTVTVVAPTCVEANTLSTAAIVRGRDAAGWLAAQGTTARFVDENRAVHRVGGWPR